MQRDDIELRELYGESLWLRFLYERAGRVLTVPGACLVWAVAQTALFAGLCWAQGTLGDRPAPGQMSLLEDTTALANYGLLPLCFVLLYYCLRLFRTYLNRLHEVLEPASLPGAKEELIALARGSFTWDGMKQARRVFFALGLLIFLFNAVTNLFPDFFYGRPLKWDGIAYPLSYAAARLYVLVAWGYVIPTWASEVYMQLSVTVRVNNRMAREGWLKVSPYAVDQFGGLGRLARSAAAAGYLLLAAGLFFLAPLLRAAVWGVQLHLGNYLGLGVYVLFAAAGLFLPVYLLHRILSRKREEMVQFLAGAFDRINAQVADLVKRGDVRGLADENLGRALESVDRLHAQWAALPSWPFSLTLVVQYLALAVPPVALFVVQQTFKQVPQ